MGSLQRISSRDRGSHIANPQTPSNFEIHDLCFSALLPSISAFLVRNKPPTFLPTGIKGGFTLLNENFLCRASIVSASPEVCQG